MRAVTYLSMDRKLREEKNPKTRTLTLFPCGVHNASKQLKHVDASLQP